MKILHPKSRRLLKALKFFEKAFALFLIANVLCFGITHIPIEKSYATASAPPQYELGARNISDGETEFSSSIALDANDVAEFRMLVRNEQAGNNIDGLRFVVSFPSSVNPAYLRATIKADSLSDQSAQVTISVPDGFYLDYVHGTTVYEYDKREEQRTRTEIGDINDTSPLTFSEGYTVNNFIGASFSWGFMYFRVTTASSPPVVIHPDIEFAKYVANTSRGEGLADKKTETQIAPGETIRIQLFIHNAILESIAHNVKIKDEKPSGSATPRKLTGRVLSDEDETKTSFITVNITDVQPIEYVPSSAVVKDKDLKVVKTLSQGEVDKLFGDGLLINDNGEHKGCWEFLRLVEYEAKVKPKGAPGNPKLTIDKKIIFEGEEYDSVDKDTHIYDADEKVEYVIRVKNIGNAKAENVQIKDVLPTYISWRSGDGDWNSGTRTITFDTFDLGVNKEEEVSYKAEVKEVLPQGDRTQENISTVCADNVTPCISDSAFIWVNGPEIEVTKVVRELPKDGAEPGVTFLLLSLLPVGVITRRFRIY